MVAHFVSERYLTARLDGAELRIDYMEDTIDLHHWHALPPGKRSLEAGWIVEEEDKLQVGNEARKLSRLIEYALSIMTGHAGARGNANRRNVLLVTIKTESDSQRSSPLPC